MMKTNNTLSGFHIKGSKDGEFVLGLKKYTWHIPKALRELNIDSGDIVGVRKEMTPFLVTDVFQEEIEETGVNYKSIKELIKKKESQ